MIAVITAIVILIMVPTISIASIEMAADNCDFSPYHEKAPIPICCLTANCQLSYCVFTKTVDNEVLLPDQPASNENVCVALSRTTVTTEISLNPKRPLLWESLQQLPSCLFTGYHCRNCLDSEEPHQV